MTHKLAVLLLGLAWLGTAQSGAIVNGDFSDGLSGWTTADTDSSLNETTPSASVGVVGGVAGLSTLGWDSGVISASLYQAQGLDPLAAWLWFDIGFVRGEADLGGDGQGFPDYFQVSWVDDDPSGDFDRAFVGVNVNGFFDPATFASVPPGSFVGGLYRFRFNIAALAGRSGTLFFDLLEQDDSFFSSASVDNVRVEIGAAPLPTTWLLLLVGLLGSPLIRRGRQPARSG